MLKLIGSLFLLCGCSGIGLLLVKNLDNRVSVIRDLLCALETMERELSFRMPLLEDMLFAAEKSVKDPTRSFLNVCREGVRKKADTPFAEIWNTAAQENLSIIKIQELESLFLLGGILGRYDCDGQKMAIEQACVELRNTLSEAIIERKSRGRVYNVLGTATGAFLAILLL